MNLVSVKLQIQTRDVRRKERWKEGRGDYVTYDALQIAEYSTQHP